jgi:acetylornithine deacetylase/succinyl-diaminopimelate desuccinylase-like protein
VGKRKDHHIMTSRLNRALLAAAAFATASPVLAEDLTPPEYVAQAKDVLKKSIGFRTVEHGGQMKPYANYLASVLKKAGFAAKDIEVIPMGDTAALVATYRGATSEKPILLSAHMDVVEAKPEDWERDPFKAVEENGYIFGRGATDNKFGLSMLVTTLCRLKKEGFKPSRDLVLVFSGDEETQMDTTAKLAERFRNADLVLNADGGGGLIGEDGKPVAYYLQGAEKTYADYTIEFTNPGGHSSAPRADNAIYELAGALKRIEAYKFPVQWNDITLGSMRATGLQTPDDFGKAMVKFADNPKDKKAIKVLRERPETVGQLGTTCVATMLSGGHALNALPQRATANVNCRIFPGVDPESVRAKLVELVDNPAAKVTVVDKVNSSDASPLRDDVMAAVKKALDRRYPGIPIVPAMSAGASDSLHFRSRGVASYGTAGLFMKASDEFSHGLNERSPVDSIDGALDHWHVLITELAG